MGKVIHVCNFYTNVVYVHSGIAIFIDVHVKFFPYLSLVENA